MFSAMLMPRRFVWCARSALVAVLVTLVLARQAGGAGTTTGAGSIAPVGRTVEPVTHGWVVNPQSGERSTVLHLPPRAGRDGVAGGMVRLAMNLRTTPVACAARSDRCYLAFEDGPRGFPLAKGRTVLSMAAVAASTGQQWVTHPAGRLDAHPSLRGDGRLLDMAGAEQGLCALMHGLTEGEADPTRLSLQILTGSKWQELALPPEIQSAAGDYTAGAGGKRTLLAECRLFSAPDGIGIVLVPPASEGRVGPEKPVCFVGTISIGKDGKPAAEWEPLRIDGEGAPLLADGRFALLVCGDHMVATISGAEEQLRVLTRPYRQGDSPWREVARLPGVPSNHITVALDGSGRVAVLWAGVPGAPDRQSMAEVSVRTGRIMYVGEARLASPITGADWRLVIVVLTYAVGLVVLFVVKVPAQEALALPAKVSLAEPMRRMMAGVIDFVLAALLASSLWDIPLTQMTNLESWVSSSAQPVMLTAVGVLIVSGTVLEAAFGRSVGKLLTGCAVVRMVTGGAPNAPSRRPSFGASLLRNFVKWALPPVALLGLLDHASRHRGDVLTNSVVVIPDDEEPTKRGEAEDDGGGGE